jgi:hypothetical protein
MNVERVQIEKRYFDFNNNCYRMSHSDGESIQPFVAVVNPSARAIRRSCGKENLDRASFFVGWKSTLGDGSAPW